MKLFTMKALAVAVLGLAGMGSAFAACPTIVGGNATPGGGGAWTSQSVAADTTFGNAATGLNGTSCALSVSVNAGALSNTRGFVSDGSPADEQRYRARFYISTAALTGFTLSNQQTKLFDAFSNTSPANISTDEVVIRLVGSATPFFRISVADSTQATGYKLINVPLPTSATSTYRVEFDLSQGAPGSFRYWVSDAAAVTSDATPTGTYAPTNTGWSGVTQVNMGLFSVSPSFRTSNANQAIIFDEFDSRRQTFIGQ